MGATSWWHFVDPMMPARPGTRSLMTSRVLHHDEGAGMGDPFADSDGEVFEPKDRIEELEVHLENLREDLLEIGGHMAAREGIQLEIRKAEEELEALKKAK